MSTRLIGVLLLSIVVVSACGGDDTTADTPAAVPDGLPADDAGDTVMAPIGPTMSVAELLAADETGPFSVEGYLFVLEDGTILFSDAIAESYPPQAGGAQVEVRGLNLQTVPLVEPAEDSELATVRWTERPIELIGSIEGGVFFASTPASS